MTKSTITREQLLEIIETDHVQCGEASYLARMALAAMDSEPVFTLEVSQADYKGQKLGNHFGFITLDAARNLKEGNYQLYRHAQPATVVPEEIKRNPETGWYVGPDGNNWSALQANSWNACRAAMLAAAPHDTHALNSVQSVVTVPGKWIPVSEQMPEDRTQVILWDAEIGEVTSGHYSHKTHTFYHCGDAIENEITHWMPTPAAPQEVK
ncbi:DUF551 domain-containing protein [Klebsiella quasipneumoniae]|uniref:DUF551 domain-containing protein n=1 Tax=Klebsiella quasipneumoniae TaxID=1463165 RepID=UPI002FE1415F